MIKQQAVTPQRSEIHHLLFMTAKHAHRGVEGWFAKQKIGITPLQFGVLRALGDDGLTLNDLARRMMFKPPSILPSIDSLERAGHILRRNDPHDRRKIHLTISAKGKRIVERVVGSKKLDPLSTAFKKLSPPKKKQLIALLTELNNTLKIDYTI
jgi:DNA-binding MarR family transcriptional regulator